MADHSSLEKYRTAIQCTAKAIARSSFGEKREKFDKISKVDLTNKIIELLNKELKSIKLN